MAVDFGLRRFREYCIGAKEIKVVTDHRPLKAIFTNKRLGSIRIDRTKLRHQYIKATKQHLREANEDAKTQEDKTLQKLLNHVRSGKKPVTPELHQYRNIFPELSISATGLLIRQHRIVLPQSLHQKAISKAHDTGHFWMCRIETAATCTFSLSTFGHTSRK